MIATQQILAVQVSIIDKETHHVEYLPQAEQIRLKQASVVVVHTASTLPYRVKRCGNTVRLSIGEQSNIQIQHFFRQQQPTDHSLVFINAQGQCIWLRFTNDFGAFYPRPHAQKIACYSELLYVLNTDSDAVMFQHNTAEYDFYELLQNSQNLPLHMQQR